MNNNLLKNRFAFRTALLLLLTLGGCSVFRPGTTSNGSGDTGPGQVGSETTASGDTRFLNSISTDKRETGETPAFTETSGNAPGGGRKDRSRTTTGPLYRPKGESSAGKNDRLTSPSDNAEYRSATPLSVLQLKYSMLISTPVEKLDNQKLLEFMDDWYGVPYHFGGTTKKGIDCSAFALTLMENVYGVTEMPRMSRDQYAASAKISRKKLREGDLVFFHTYGKGKTVTHVGVYLYNNRFVHASVSGVQIDDLEGNYYSRHFVGAGRILE